MDAWKNPSFHLRKFHSLRFIHEEPPAANVNRHKYLSIGNNRWSAVRRAGKREKDLPALSRKLKGVPRRGRPAARQSSSLISRHSRFFHFYRCKHRAKGLRFEITYLRGIESRPFLNLLQLNPAVRTVYRPREQRTRWWIIAGEGRSSV